jgi:phosphoribosylformylglycinamidine synthase
MTFAAYEILERALARELGQSMGLSAAELEVIEQALGRVPTRSELCMFAGMWSEHCSYKSTKHLLATLPRHSDRVLAGPGAHAGVVDVGEGWAVAFKVESHNHPSAVEPYQGAATGVGGILRDVIAQGARPCAVMDSLCFGDKDSPRVKHLEEGVVAGIAGYGNAFGVPNIGGRTAYAPGYEGNPLVNALAAGLVRPQEMRTGEARGSGNAVLYVGAPTGRDGILGAAFASEELADDTVDDRPHVQVGDPFTGKKLMEACLSFSEGLVAGQDMGACGITCAACEMAALGGVGMDLDLDAVPLREDDMPAHEILLSESQERFLFVIERGSEEAALAHFRAHGVSAAIIGRITDTDRVRARFADEWVADVPASLVADGTPPTHWPAAEGLAPAVPYPTFSHPADLTAVLQELLAEPGIADLQPLYSHYDQTVGNRTVRGPGEAEAAVLKLPDSHRGFALTLIGRGDLCAAHPFHGVRAVLGEACRNLACAGAEIMAITDGLNMGSPEDPVEFKKLVETVRGLKDGLEALGIPVTGGNVSLYNESKSGAIPPTPMIGALGVISDVRNVPRAGLASGEVLFLLGHPSGGPVTCRYGALRTGQRVAAMPAADLERDRALARLLVEQIDSGRIRAAKDGGAGGLGVALAKLSIRGGCGVRIALPEYVERIDWFLFGEYPGTAWVATLPEYADKLVRTAGDAGVPCFYAGECGGERLWVDGALDARIEDLARAFCGASQ